jgi:hypothetical protein
MPRGMAYSAAFVMFGEGQDLRLELQRVMSDWSKEWGEDGSMGLISAGDKGKGGLLD